MFVSSCLRSRVRTNMSSTVSNPAPTVLLHKTETQSPSLAQSSRNLCSGHTYHPPGTRVVPQRISTDHWNTWCVSSFHKDFPFNCIIVRVIGICCWVVHSDPWPVCNLSVTSPETVFGYIKPSSVVRIWNFKQFIVFCGQIANVKSYLR